MPLVESPLSLKKSQELNRLGRPKRLTTLVSGTLAVVIALLGVLGLEISLVDDKSVYPATVDLPQFHQVDPYLLRGGAPTDAGLRKLKDMGVKTIIDFRRNPGMVLHEKLVTSALGINYINLPTGNLWPKSADQAVFMKIIGAAATDGRQAPVFIHCAHGTDRTGFYVAKWRIEHDAWPVTKAVAEMLKYGFVLHKLQK